MRKKKDFPQGLKPVCLLSQYPGLGLIPTLQSRRWSCKDWLGAILALQKVWPVLSLSYVRLKETSLLSARAE